MKKLELISIHIPKTGGRSFNNILKKVYGPKQVFHISQERLRRNHQKLEEIIPEQVTVFHGHVKFRHILPLCQKSSFPVVTWVRDPVGRVISNYYFLLERIQAGARPDGLLRQNKSLVGYIRWKRARNVMSRFLKGTRLQDLFFVGILECFKEDLDDLGCLLRWQGIKSFHINSNREFKSQFPPVSQEVREEIKELNKMDVALYEEALELRNMRRQKKSSPFFWPFREWSKK